MSRHRQPHTRSARRTGALIASATLAALPGPAHAGQDPGVPPAAPLPAVTRPLDSLPPLGEQRAAAPMGATLRFDIPPGPLGDVIKTYEAVTHVTIRLADEAMAPMPSAGASGMLTNAEALTALLAGTGLTFRFVSPAEAVVEFPRLQQSVDVVGRSAVVESPKYVVPLRSIPQTIEVIPRAAMEQQAVTTLSDALRNVPGITLQAGEGGGASNTAGDMFNMRGFNASNSLFVDGVRDDGLVSRDVFNLEQVEVFMGPTGSDVGRGTAAGYVNMETKTPHLESAIGGAATVGSGVQRRVTFDVSHRLPLRSSETWLGKSAVRLNALVQDSGVPGRDEVDLSSKGIAPSLALGIGTKTRVTAAAQILHQDNVPDYGVPGAAWDEPLTPATVLAPAPVAQSNYYGSPAFDYDRADQQTYTARVEHDASPRLTLRNQ